jgi:hypothetical protein
LAVTLPELFHGFCGFVVLNIDFLTPRAFDNYEPRGGFADRIIQLLFNISIVVDIMCIDVSDRLRSETGSERSITI